ncbi:glycosyltransferase family 4 protein [Haloferula sp. BvORR071]|uniref:glycosyltransferase family 4 protein n=1 Tax=Haloferula sp. BvORR071 TaxID=1396141 RepID=UPI0005508564|nr:glycosyltransferase family 4 protein [Haloferula sp. BvORR071]
MNLILINQYYPPDVAPTGLMLESVAEELAALGHHVTILCSRGGYGGQKGEAASARAATDGVEVVHCWSTAYGRRGFLGKIADYASFYLGVAWGLCTARHRPDRVVALTTPPYLSVLARVFSKFLGADHAHWVMDLYPDVMAAHGLLDPRSLPYRMLSRLARFGFGGSRCAEVITLGPDMAELTGRYTPDDVALPWIPLWGTESVAESDADAEEHARALRLKRGWSEDETIVMYSGNMGLGHRFGEILSAAAEFRRGSGIRFVFFGEGKRRKEIEEFIARHPEAPIELHGYVPRDELAGHLRSANAQLASLEPAWDGTMVPSKLQGIFAAGRPVIFIGSHASSIGTWVRESGGGWVVEPGDLQAMKAALEHAMDPGECEFRGAFAKAFSAHHFDKRRNSREVARLLARPH